MSIPAGPIELQAFKRFLMILYFILFATLPLYWFAQEQVAQTTEANISNDTKLFLYVAAAGVVAVVLFLRLAKLGPLLATPVTDLPVTLARARFYYILCYTLSEAVALYGFVMRVLGSSYTEALPFYAASAALFVLCYPKTPQPMTSGPMN